MEYSKSLTRPEARHRYWHIHKEYREFFPGSGKIFEIRFHDKIYELNVNHKDDIMTGKLYEKYRFLKGDRIVIIKDSDGRYDLKAPDTEPYPSA